MALAIVPKYLILLNKKVNGSNLVYNYSKGLNVCLSHQVVPRLLGSLVGGAMSPTQHLEQQQALVKQFAEILEFVLKFDEHKVSDQHLRN